VTDRRTDGQNCYINIARQYADARQNVISFCLILLLSSITPLQSWRRFLWATRYCSLRGADTFCLTKAAHLQRQNHHNVEVVAGWHCLPPLNIHMFYDNSVTWRVWDAEKAHATAALQLGEHCSGVRPQTHLGIFWTRQTCLMTMILALSVRTKML